MSSVNSLGPKVSTFGQRGAEVYFKEKMMEIYKIKPYSETVQHEEFLIALQTIRSNFDGSDFKDLLTYWGSAGVNSLQTNNNETILEIVAKYGSAKDLDTFKSCFGAFTDDQTQDIKKWAEQERNGSISDYLSKRK